MAKTSRQKFVKLIKKQIGSGYIWGAQGEEFTKSKLDKFVNWFGRTKYYFNNYSAEKWLNDGKKDFDCSGLIVWGLQQLKFIRKEQDFTAAGIFKNLCLNIYRRDLEDGDLLFKENSRGIITHVGVYYKGQVIHAKGTYYGVVMTDEVDIFDTFGRLKFFAHWALEDAIYLRKQGIEVNNLDLDRKVTFGEVIAMNARITKKLKNN